MDDLGWSTLSVSDHRKLNLTRFSDGTTFTVITTRTDAYKFSFFPRTVREWNSLTPPIAVKGYAHCCVYILKN